MRKYFVAKAYAHSYEVIDMDPIFAEHYRNYGGRFEFPTDSHWNELGHQIAADAVMRTQTIRNTLLTEK